jgi:uncharacterized protein
VNTYSHFPGTLAERQGRLIRNSETGDDYFYDSSTALLLQIRPELARDIMGSQIEPSTYDLHFDAGAALTIVEERLSSGHMAEATKVDAAKTLALGIEPACNLSCTYCYNDAHFQRPSLKDESRGMSLDVALASIDQALTALVPGDLLTIQLIGGEPLLQFSMLKVLIPAGQALARSRGCELQFGMNTNGLLLTNEIVDFLFEHKVGIAVSLDGDREQHNQHRRFSTGHGSYDVLLPRIRYFITKYSAPGRTLSARVTIGDEDYDIVRAVRHCLELGFNNIGIGIAIGALLATCENEDAKRNVVAKLTRQMEELKKFTIGEYKSKNLFRVSLFNDTMFTVYAHRPKLVPCGAGRRYAGVSPNGDVVPCHRYIGTSRTDRILGSVASAPRINALSPESRAASIDRLPFGTVADDHTRENYECSNCWARHICGGECYEIKDVMNDEFAVNKPFMCDFKRSLFALGLEMLIDLQEDPSTFMRLMEMNATLKPEEARANTIAALRPIKKPAELVQIG